jgi:hypothetical protein
MPRTCAAASCCFTDAHPVSELKITALTKADRNEQLVIVAIVDSPSHLQRETGFCYCLAGSLPAFNDAC